MGLLPMYMFDNDEWLPYKGSPNDVILSANCSTEAQTAEGNTKTANSFFFSCFLPSTVHFSRTSWLHTPVYHIPAPCVCSTWCTCLIDANWWILCRFTVRPDRGCRADRKVHLKPRGTRTHRRFWFLWGDL